MGCCDNFALPADLTPASLPPAVRPEKNQQLHILTIAPFYPVEGDDGYGCFIAEPLRSLEKEGITNTVIVSTPFYRGTRPVHRAAVPAMQLRYFSLPKGFGLASSGVFLFSRIAHLIRKLHIQRRVDLIHAHGPLPCGHAASLLFQYLQIPYVVTAHGLDAYSVNQVKSLPGRWSKDACRKTYQSARRVICVSEHVRAQVENGGSFSTEVVYNGIDPQLFVSRPVSHAEQPVILSVGNLITAKGHDTLLRAFSQLLRDFPGIRCEIAGDGPERKRLSRLVADLGMAEQVTFHGRLSRKQVAAAMQRCTVFALPSSYEALGCVYLEAMACGKPIIACSGQGIEEVIQNGENGLLVQPGDSDGLVKALSELLRNNDCRRQIGANGQRTVLHNFTLAQQATNLARIYVECVR